MGLTSRPEACPDGGTCHHLCDSETGIQSRGGACFRVLYADPLSIAGFPDDRWPDDVLNEHRRLRANPPKPDWLPGAVRRAHLCTVTEMRARSVLASAYARAAAAAEEC